MLTKYQGNRYIAQLAAYMTSSHYVYKFHPRDTKNHL
jgi:hypothetical protein